MTFWAHSDPSGLPPTAPNAKWQPLGEHLTNVSDLARKLAGLARPGDENFQDLSECCGLLHDFGKYSDCFQKMILTGKGRCPHAIHGAAALYFSSGEAKGSKQAHIALAVAGHHAGIPNMQGGGSALVEKLKKYRQEAIALINRATQDCARLRDILQTPFPLAKIELAQFDLFTRMLFSCLVDADRLDSASRAISQTPLNAAEKLEALLAHVGQLAAESSADHMVNCARRQVLQDCLAAAAYTEQLLSLTVPDRRGQTGRFPRVCWRSNEKTFRLSPSFPPSFPEFPG